MGLLTDYLYGKDSNAGGGAGENTGLLSRYLQKKPSGYTDDAGMSDTIHNKKHSKKHAKVCHKKHTHKKGACK